MGLDNLQFSGAPLMRRRSFVALLTGGVLGSALPGRLGASGLLGANQTGRITLNDYQAIPPEGWEVKQNTDHFLMQNPQSGCLIQLFEPQPLRGDLEQLSHSFFEKAFAGWQFRQTGEKKYVLSTGVLPTGLAFFMTEAEMSKDGAEFGGFQDGAALVVQAGAQVVIIGARHPSLMSDHRRCVASYTTWRRFFNSFGVRNAPIVTEPESELSRRIVGRWGIHETLGVADYVFAANGTYSSDGTFGGVRSGQRREVGREGRYSVAGDRLTMTTPQRTVDQVRFRFDRVNHGGIGWKDRLHMLKKDLYGENETSYERQ